MLNKRMILSSYNYACAFIHIKKIAPTLVAIIKKYSLFRFKVDSLIVIINRYSLLEFKVLINIFDLYI